MSRYFLQVFCIFLFLCAASLFGTIIAQVNEIVADLTTKKKDLDRILEAYLVLNPRSESALDTVRVPTSHFNYFGVAYVYPLVCNCNV